ncbi:MAG: M48 family metallopeptidase [Alphaproteobacteria bacterium]|nr:M48 family metallopeptidase [Alphaproteobacteria bacterium]
MTAITDNLFFSLQSGEQIPIVIESKKNVHNVILRPKIKPTRQIHISKPVNISVQYALKFLYSKSNWLNSFFIKKQKRQLQSGDTIAFLDKSVIVINDSTKYSNKYNEDKTILYIGGCSELFEYRLREFIKKEFLDYAKNVIKNTPRELWPIKITLRDTTTRWGSCSSTGTISLSWRLAFAPLSVSQYVIMHELAHRKYMNHSAEFWHFVSVLYGFGVERAKTWLKQNVDELNKYF